MVILYDRKDIKKERKKIFLFMNWEDNMKNHFDVCRNDDAVWRERQIDGKWMKKSAKENSKDDMLRKALLFVLFLIGIVVISLSFFTIIIFTTAWWKMKMATNKKCNLYVCAPFVRNHTINYYLNITFWRRRGKNQ